MGDIMKEYRKISVSLDRETLKKIDELAERDKTYNRSAVIRKAVDLLYSRNGDNK